MPFLKLIRPEQWVKNLFVFLPLFFNGSLWNFFQFYNAFIAFISFCFMASSIYCINDIKDVEADRIHPEKRNRPLASNLVSIRQAWIISGLFIVAAIGITFLLPLNLAFPLLEIVSLYLVINLGYTYKLKQISILDIMIVSLGFVLRVLAGGVTTYIKLSPWIILMTFLLALFLAFAKRRDDVLKMNKDNLILRKSIRHYNLLFVDQCLGILAAVIIVSYILYTLSDDVSLRHNGEWYFYTTLFVIAGILRYLQITLVTQKSGSPTKILLRDNFIQISILLWIISFLFIIYL